MCNKEMGIGEKFCPGDALLLLSEAAAASIWQNQRLSFDSQGPFYKSKLDITCKHVVIENVAVTAYYLS